LGHSFGFGMSPPVYGVFERCLKSGFEPRELPASKQGARPMFELRTHLAGRSANR
jgi:hypothetical protein